MQNCRKNAQKYARYLLPEPVPQCYAAGQELARSILLKGGNGILYPSVRFEDGLCIACFRPVLVYRVRSNMRFEFSLQAGRAFTAGQVRKVKRAASGRL